MIPPRAVEHRSRERVETFDLGISRVVQHTGRRDHDVDVVAMSRGRREMPSAGRVLALRDRVTEADSLHDAVVLGDPFEVGLYLGTGRESVTPVRCEREGVRVQV